MQVIIPMSGFGERFKKAGYTIPKFLIELEGKPIIAHVIDLFPGETDFTFICNELHMKEFPVEATLKRYCPTAKIHVIPPHKKGPVHTVLSIREQIDVRKPTIVNYCDFTCYWDYPRFMQWAQTQKLDGALPAYRGFHPHSLAGNYYAYIKEENLRVQDIQEKKPFTTTPMQEFASTGTYYFKSGATMLECFDAVVAQNLTINNEYYISMAYKPLLESGAQVGVYEVEHFMQWGTPEDVQEYQYWSDIFTKIAHRKPYTHPLPGTVMIPMAGLGERFSKAGYALPKPLIPVDNLPMVIRATEDLPPAANYVFAIRTTMAGHEKIAAELTRHFAHSRCVMLEKATEGQAHTCLLACTDIADTTPLTISACDNGVIVNDKALADLLRKPDVDVVVWVARGLPGAARNPKMYSWVEAEGGRVKHVSVKKPLQNPACDPIVIGTFTFKSSGDFKHAAQQMMHENTRVNGEFYVDTCINDAVKAGLRCHVFEVDAFLCWGTPDELKTFEYWQSCFKKWPAHGYTAEM